MIKELIVMDLVSLGILSIHFSDVDTICKVAASASIIFLNIVLITKNIKNKKTK